MLPRRVPDEISDRRLVKRQDANLSMTTNTQKSVSTEPFISIRLSICLLCMAAFTANAQTPVCGDIYGTWAPAGNPYIVTCDATVPSGQTLTIQPGVTVWIGENVSITANGLIQAVGTPTQRITFQAPITSQYWSNISCLHASGTNRFKYCDFRNADTALRMRIYGGNDTMSIEIMNCSFSNCVSRGIYGEAQGAAGFGWRQSATLNPMIKNCVFNSTGNGCEIQIYGTYYSAGQYDSYEFGYASPRLIGNIFNGLTGAAFLMSAGSYAGSGSPIFINNTIVNCRVGVDSQAPWDARVQDNIFVGTTNAVKTSGSLSRSIGYNCFSANATNFTGYPSTYGNWIIPNRNGTLSDLSYNFEQDPLFVSASDFHLQADSPCIDAGTPDWAFSDMCFADWVSQGTSYPDLGVYGGPDAANWLDVVPRLPAQATLSKSNDVIQINWGGIPRSEYRVQYLASFALAGTNTWLNFPNGKVLATEKPTSLIVATGSSQTNMFFRIQSLGRTPGN